MEGVVGMSKREDMGVVDGVICSCSDMRGVRFGRVVTVDLGVNLWVFFRPSGVRR